MNDSVSRFLSVVKREMRTMGRGRALFFLRCGYAVLLIGILWMVFDAPFSNASFWRGAGISALAGISASAFTTLVRFQSVVVMVLSPLLGVLCITGEWRDKTLGLLVLSPMRASEVVAGKTASLLGFLGMFLIAPLPLFALLGWAGGMEYRWLGGLAILSLILGLAGISVGVVSALRYRGSVAASVCSFALLGALLILPVALIQRVPASVRPYIETLHPLAAIDIVATQGINKQYFALALCLYAGFGFLLLCYASWDLPRAVGRTPLRGLRSWFTMLDELFRRINVGGIEIVPSRPDQPIRGNPVSWLSRSGQGLGSAAHIFRWASAVTIFCLLSLYLLLSESHDELFFATLFLGMVLAALTAGAAAIAGERSRKSLTVLLACPLSARGILAGKVRASLRFFAIVGLPLVLYCTVVLTFLNHPYSLVYSVLGMFLLLGETACAFSLALACSLYMRTPLRAGMSALFLLGALHVLPMIGGAAGYGIFQFGPDVPARGLLRLIVFPLLTVAMVVGACCVFAFARFRRSPGLQAIALLFAVLPVLGLAAFFPVGEHPIIENTLEWTSNVLRGYTALSRWIVEDMAGFLWLGVLLLAFSHLTIVHAARCFDRALGRST